MEHEKIIKKHIAEVSDYLKNPEILSPKTTERLESYINQAWLDKIITAPIGFVPDADKMDFVDEITDSLLSMLQLCTRLVETNKSNDLIREYLVMLTGIGTTAMIFQECYVDAEKVQILYTFLSYLAGIGSGNDKAGGILHTYFK